MSPEDKVKRLQYEVSMRLEEIAALFTQRPKITIICRTPWLSDGRSAPDRRRFRLGDCGNKPAARKANGMNWNPIKRSPLKPKSRQHKESMPWRRPKVRLSGSEMKDLRQSAFARSQGRCENSITPDGARCPARINWMSFHLAHIVSRGRGGSDELANVLAACQQCHEADTHNQKKLRPHQDWIAAA